MDFKERVFQARKAKGFSQEGLAEVIGVSRQAVSKWETGEAMPDLEKLIALCNALDQNIEYLALGKGSVPSKKPSPKLKPWVAILLSAVFLVAGFLIGLFCHGRFLKTAPQPMLWLKCAFRTQLLPAPQTEI